MVHKLDNKMAGNLPVAENGNQQKRTYGIHKSQSWFEEVDQAIRSKERAIAKYQKELEEREMERDQKLALEAQIEDLDRERMDLDLQRQGLELREQEVAERESSVQKYQEPVETKPIMPVIKEDVRKVVGFGKAVGKEAKKIPDVLFFKTKKNDKNEKT